MRGMISIILITFFFLFAASCTISHATDLTLNNTPIQVYFSPKGGCTEAIIKQITQAKSEIVVQANSFTSAPIAKALLDAHKRGLHVGAILDKSQRTENEEGK